MTIQQKDEYIAVLEGQLRSQLHSQPALFAGGLDSASINTIQVQQFPTKESTTTDATDPPSIRPASYTKPPAETTNDQTKESTTTTTTKNAEEPAMLPPPAKRKNGNNDPPPQSQESTIGTHP